MFEDKTTILVSQKTRNLLKAYARKSQTYDQAILELIEKHGGAKE